MSLPRTVAEVLSEHVTLELESPDRLYLNLYVPRLQYPGGAVGFFRHHRGQPFASSALMAPMTRAFVRSMESYCREGGIPVITFRPGERKDDVAQAYLARCDGQEGILFAGKAQEKARVFRTEKRRNPETGRTYPWISWSTAMVNAWYFYGLDAEFGPFFLKYGTYFPYTGRFCLNGHEYLKRQAARRGIAFEALDNGIAWCDDPARVQRIADGLSPAKIEAFVRKWIRRLPCAYTKEDRAARYRYDISVLQAEFALTQVFDRPRSGRVFFEEVIRENLDLGRPSQVALIFDRRVTKRTPSRFRTRVITEGVVPSLHIDYKHSRCKQYFKEGRALRTETTINDARDFSIGKRLCNLPALREVGFQANRRLLGVQRLSHDPIAGQEAFERVTRPAEVDGQRASALRFEDPRVHMVLACLLVFRFLAHGFANKDLRALLAPLLGIDPALMTQGRMTYQLRRLRLHGLIERIPHTHRYRVTEFGFRTALVFSRTYARILRPTLAHACANAPPVHSRLRKQFDRLEALIDQSVEWARVA